MLILKDSSVKLKDLSPQILLALMAAERVFEKYGYDCIVTSVNDGKHSINSKHYVGYAVDLRSKHIKTLKEKLDIFSELKINLTAPSNYDILFEYEGLPNEHYHIEYDPK